MDFGTFELYFVIEILFYKYILPDLELWQHLACYAAERAALGRWAAPTVASKYWRISNNKQKLLY